MLTNELLKCQKHFFLIIYCNLFQNLGQKVRSSKTHMIYTTNQLNPPPKGTSQQDLDICLHFRGKYKYIHFSGLTSVFVILGIIFLAWIIKVHAALHQFTIYVTLYKVYEVLEFIVAQLIAMSELQPQIFIGALAQFLAQYNFFFFVKLCTFFNILHKNIYIYILTLSVNLAKMTVLSHFWVGKFHETAIKFYSFL